MPDCPTIHVTNWSSRALHGPGRALTIMARPRAWERGVGRVPWLTPADSDLRDAKAGRLTLEEYRGRFEAYTGGPAVVPPVGYMGGKRKLAASILGAAGLRPGQGAERVLLVDAGEWGGVWSEVVRDGLDG